MFRSIGNLPPTQGSPIPRLQPKGQDQRDPIDRRRLVERPTGRRPESGPGCVEPRVLDGPQVELLARGDDLEVLELEGRFLGQCQLHRPTRVAPDDQQMTGLETLGAPGRREHLGDPAAQPEVEEIDIEGRVVTVSEGDGHPIPVGQGRRSPVDRANDVVPLSAGVSKVHHSLQTTRQSAARWVLAGVEKALVTLHRVGAIAHPPARIGRVADLPSAEDLALSRPLEPGVLIGPLRAHPRGGSWLRRVPRPAPDRDGRSTRLGGHRLPR